MKFKNKEVVETLELEYAAGETIPLIITGGLYEDDDGTSIKGQDCVWVLDTLFDKTKDESFVKTKPIYQLVEPFLQRFPLLRLFLSYLIF